ncbi:FMN-dependent oxidoreductase, nitrilotriacetate monooxygenase family [Paenibacillus sp. UNCCL117]|uniref:LLM class flavin-dependent oxidoreductase n=1 Tax=unclassified Paenibacillus TaxID=185978 RepID=UPI000888B580|nr:MULTISPECIES: LLM class flavin-dependent oxidoreductase [unclassified Paenibacillus]SDE28566.1 FMN-dependent oxidoreductase, nitrilotriacetate monooxygenase family [Paenibacillus sp. cl123]SFW63449.1 FMN-dependent oxidoreductase, nitrilotriacetate monooxygenase family [Paenibacillus sp. UNCCL117]
MSQHMHLGLFVAAGGHHAGGWRHRDAVTGSSLDLDFYARIARQAERAKLDMLFIADKLAIDDNYGGSFDLTVTHRPTLSAEPLTLISALGAVTTHIGLAATASTTYHEPYHIARMFATLDHLSKGRVAWNVVTSTSDAEARNFGKTEHLDHATRYERAEEFIEVVRALWDSWEADALVLDKERGVFADKRKIHYVHHRGPWFDVKGPLNVQRSPQGHPVLIQAGSSETFRELAARHAELIFTAQPNIASAQSFYRDFKSRVVKRGRSLSDVSILPGTMLIVGSTEREAQEKELYLQSLIDTNTGLAFMSGSMNYDLSRHDPNAPFPDIESEIRGSRGRFQFVFRKAREEGLTLAQTARWYIQSRSHHIVTGTPDAIADRLTEWFRAEACDGFNLMAPYMPGGLDDICERVVPELQNRGVFRSEYTASTLRGHFGLGQPANRFAAGENEQEAGFALAEGRERL